MGLISPLLIKLLSVTALVLLGVVGQSDFAANFGYQQPPKKILDVMRAPPLAVPSLSPTHDKLLLITEEDFPSIERVSAPYLRLAGVRVEPRNHAKHDTPGGYGIPACVNGLTLVQVADGSSQKVSLEGVSCASPPLWNAAGTYFAFEDRAASEVKLWVGNAKTGKLTQIRGVKINPMFGEEMAFLPDQQSLLIKTVPKRLGAAPKASITPEGPSIQETRGEKGQSSTYEKRDTLNNKHDEDLFEYFGVSQLARVDVVTGKVTLLGDPGLYVRTEASPDGSHLLVSKIVKPFSYLTTYRRFPNHVEIWQMSNARLLSHVSIASIPLTDRVPIHGVPKGPRDFNWKPTEPATLIWAEALDEGDWNVKVPHRDKVMISRAPFQAPTELLKVEQRFAGLEWLDNSNLALLNQEDENLHWEKTFIVNGEDPSQAPRLLFDHSSDEMYKDPGMPIYRRLKNGAKVVRYDQGAIFMRGRGASENGDRPFLDKWDLQSTKSERLFRSEKTAYEQPLDFTGADEQKFLTWHQTPEDPPNAFVRTLAERTTPTEGEATFHASGAQVTHLTDPTPELRQIKKRLVKYKRADGLDLSFTLYTPPGYKEGTRVPTILYAYPLDFAEAAQAGQVSGSQMTFTQLRNYKLLLLAGYAIIDKASFPIVGDPKKAYDTYLDQLLADAKAAVDEAVRLGVADPKRIGVTGHSHGALMTANLVTHSDLFRAGVATSGAYNKFLTPRGFQSERRSLWEAPEVYRKVSPFLFADHLKTPLLLVHGAEDANPGTQPEQASFYYEAIRGNGGTARLVMLPHEPHWYAARESNEHLLYEMINWFDKYLLESNLPASR